MSFIRPFVYVFLVLMLAPVAVSAGTYKWMDSRGVTHYSDSVPPEDSGQAREIIDKSGRTLEMIERSKTVDELKEQRRLDKIKAAKLEKSRQKKYRDKVLLLTYQSPAEIIVARDNKITTIENAIQIAKGTLKSQKKKLVELRQSAGDYERSSRTVPKRLQVRIKELKGQIKDTKDYIASKHQEQKDIYKEFAGFITRYKELTE